MVSEPHGYRVSDVGVPDIKNLTARSNVLGKISAVTVVHNIEVPKSLTLILSCFATSSSLSVGGYRFSDFALPVGVPPDTYC